MRLRHYLISLLQHHQDQGNCPNRMTCLGQILAQQIQPAFKHLAPGVKQHSYYFGKLMIASFPLQDADWQALFAPLGRGNHLAGSRGMRTLILKHSAAVNANFTHAIFRGLLDKNYRQLAVKDLLKKIQSVYGLDKSQIKIFPEFIAVYDKIATATERQFCCALFQTGGKIQQLLALRDQKLQQIHNWGELIFSPAWVAERLFDINTAMYTRTLNSFDEKTIHQGGLQQISAIIKQMPDGLVHWLQKIIRQPDLVNEFNKAASFLRSFLKAYQLLEKADKNRVWQQCIVIQQPHDLPLSLKEQAQEKWLQFTQREMKHALFHDARQVNQLFSDLLVRVKPLQGMVPLCASLKELYHKLLSDGVSKGADGTFYQMAAIFQEKLAKDIKKSRDPHKKKHCRQAQQLLTDFVNVVMNAVVNKKLDKVDIMDGDNVEKNPLEKQPHIQAWLLKVSQTTLDLRHLLVQQLQQSPSLDHAVWRNSCILSMIERAMRVTDASLRVRGTGMQKLFRQWNQSRYNITRQGQVYRNQRCLPVAVGNVHALFNRSVKMVHAFKRTVEKHPQCRQRLATLGYEKAS